MSPRSILITGASSGIGAALAAAYADHGVTLFLTGRDTWRLEETETRCRTRGASVHTKSLDVLDRTAMAAWIDACDAIAPLDLVIANAGISGGTGGGPEWIESERRIFEVNVTGVLNTVEPALRPMIKRKSGQIAVMSSVASFSGWPGAPAYSASKGAVRMWGEGLRGALAPEGIQVSVICPGFIDTPMTDINDFPMPFKMSADRAAGLIISGLRGNKARIAFPWQTYGIAGVFGLLPAGLSARLLSRLPGKPALQAHKESR
jgi:short-subunit dehydrogenase